MIDVFIRSLRQVLVACVAALMGCSAVSKPPLETVERVDLKRYTGKWYEIARYPARFQEGCTATTADYSLRPDGRIEVVNVCHDQSLDGPERRVEGVARVVDRESQARLKVSFFWPFEGDYYIIDLAADYSWAVVGEPGRKYLWILSRTPSLDESTFQYIVSRLPSKGYDAGKLIRTEQIASAP